MRMCLSDDGSPRLLLADTIPGYGTGRADTLTDTTSNDVCVRVSSSTTGRSFAYYSSIMTSSRDVLTSTVSYCRRRTVVYL